MKNLVIAILLTGVAIPVTAAVSTVPVDTSQCAKVSPVTRSTDIAALQADADCFGNAAAADDAAADALRKAQASARGSQQYRLDRIADIRASTPIETAVDNPMTGQAPGVGAPDIATTDFDVNKALKPSWDCTKDTTGKSICGQPAPDSGDILGAFRFICRHTNLAYDDPTVFHNQPGKSHLHDQTGVYNWNAYSNYANLREKGGGSGCNDVAGEDKNLAELTWSANRTPYWQPALLDGKGNVILADYTAFYYKSRPFAGAKADPVVTDPSNPKYQGKGVILPNGIKFVFGPKLVNGQVISTSPIELPTFSCVDPSGHPIAFDGSFAGAVQCVRDHNGVAGAGYQLKVNMSAPTCWNGTQLDSADHRSHLSYVTYGSWGYPKCDAAHPFVIPAFTYAAEYTILSSDDGDIHFSSDEMDNSKPRGWSFHVDYGPAAWDPKVLQMWTDGCVNSKLNCSGGDLGNGLQLKGAAEPIYYDSTTDTWKALWRNPVRLVPVPQRANMLHYHGDAVKSTVNTGE